MSGRIVVFGNSHTEAIASAAREGVHFNGVSKIDLLWLKTARHGTVELEDALDVMRGLAPEDVLAITYLGTMHNRYGLFEHERPIGIMRHVGGDHDGGRELIPTALLRQHFAQCISEERIIIRIVKIAGCQIVHFPPPPPKRNLTSATKQSLRADGALVTLKFAQPALRLAIREIELEAVGGYLKQLGVSALPAPVEALDEEGFLKVSHAASDATHANAAYGNLVLHQILDVIRKGTAAEGEPR